MNNVRSFAYSCSLPFIPVMQSNLYIESSVYLHAAWVHFLTCWKLKAVLDILVPFRSAKYNGTEQSS